MDGEFEYEIATGKSKNGEKSIPPIFIIFQGKLIRFSTWIIYRSNFKVSVSIGL